MNRSLDADDRHEATQTSRAISLLEQRRIDHIAGAVTGTVSLREAIWRAAPMVAAKIEMMNCATPPRNYRDRRPGSAMQ